MSSPQLSSDKNYQIIRTLGAGSFGQILGVRFYSDNKFYAVKEIDLKKLPKEERAAALYETMSEYRFQNKKIPNVLRGIGSHYDKQSEVFKYSTELMGMNLKNLIEKEKKRFSSFSEFSSIFCDILSGTDPNFKN